MIQLQDGENYVAVWPKATAEKAPVMPYQGLVRTQGRGQCPALLLLMPISGRSTVERVNADPT